MVRSGDTYTLSYALDEEWLGSAAFPVMVDPTVNVNTGTDGSLVDDNRISEGHPTTNYRTSTMMATGHGDTSHRNYSLVRFNELPNIDPDQIYEAHFSVITDSTFVQTSTVQLHNITGTWSASTLTWNNRPTYDSNVATSLLLTATINTGVTCTWDGNDASSGLVQMVQGWYTTNYGLLMRDSNETANYYKEWTPWNHSTNNGPVLVLKYDDEAPSAPSSDPAETYIDPNTWTSETSPMIYWSGITDSGGSELDHAEYKIDSGSYIAIPTEDGIGEGSTQIDLSGCADGTRTIYIRGVDSVGNTGTAVSLSYYLDTTSPSAPTSLSLDPSSWTNNVNPTISFTASTDNVSAIDFYEYCVDDNETWIQLEEGNELDMAAYSDGEHTVALRAIDLAGNISAESQNVTYYKDALKLEAVSKYNYTTLLRWDTTSTPNCTYDIQKKKAEDVEYTSTVATGLTGSYWIDFEVVYGQEYDYRIIAKETGNDDILSREVSGVNISQAAIEKQFGNKPFYTGVEFSTGSGSGNVNIVSGNLYYSRSDFAQNMPGMVLVRSYNSLAESKSALGKGWDFNYNINLFKEINTSGTETAVLLKLGDGTVYRFVKQTSGYDKPQGAYLSLVLNSGVYTVTTKDKTVYLFDGMLRLSTITDRNGNCITLSYNEDRGYLETVSNDVGDGQTLVDDEMTFTYTLDTTADEPDRLASVTDASAREYIFEYNTSLELIKGYIEYDENTPCGEEYTYAASGYLGTIFNPNDNDTTVTYLGSKVDYITNALDEVLDFTYTTGETVAEFRNAETVYEFDTTTYLLESVENALGALTEFEYDANFNLASTSYENEYYDVTTQQLIVDDVVETFVYDSEGNLLQHTRPDGYSTYYIFETGIGLEFGQPKAVISPFALDGSTVHFTLQSFTYDSNGNVLTSSQISKGTYINSVFTQEGSAVGSTETFTYEADGDLLTHVVTTGAFSRTTTYTYDNRHRLTRTTNNDNSFTEQSYDEYGNTATSTDAESNTTEYTYDILGRQIEVLNPDETTTSQTYDLNGNALSSTDAEGEVTAFEYDDLDRCVKTVYPDDTPESQEDNPFDTIVFLVDSNGNTTITSTDADGVISITKENVIGQTIYTESGDAKTYSMYDNAGNVVLSCDNSGGIFETHYDILGRNVASVTDPSYANLLYLIPSGWGVSINSSPKNQINTYVYDLAGNMLHSNVDGVDVENTYDAASRVTMKKAARTANGQSGYIETYYEYDSVVSDISGYLLQNKTIDGLDREKYYLYDDMGRLVKEIDEGETGNQTRRTTSYVYDNNGNMLTMTRNDDSVVSYTYDELNRMTRKEYSASHYVTYEYNGNGNLTLMTQVCGSVTTTSTYVYDERGNKIEEKRNGVTIANYKYTDNNSLNKITYAPKNSVSTVYEYGYDTDGRLLTVSDRTGQNNYVVREFSYDTVGKLGFLKDYREFNTSGTDYTQQLFDYDDAGRLIGVEYKDNNVTSKEKYFLATDTNGKIIQEVINTNYGTQVGIVKGYSYDECGRLISESNSTANISYDTGNKSISMIKGSDTWTYTFNDYNQLITIAKNEIVETTFVYANTGTPSTQNISGVTISNIFGTATATYIYDDVNNRVTMTKGNDHWDYTYNEFNQLLSIVKNDDTQNPETTFTYDDRGNQRTQTQSGITITYNYDLADRLTSVERTEGGNTVTVASYTYDGADQRVSQTIGSDTIVYYYNGISLLYTEDGSGNRLEENIIEPDGSVIASKRFNGDYAGNYYFYRQDVRGSVTNIVDADDTVVKGYAYDAYGNTVETGSSTFINSTAYTGAVNDTATGLIYMNARYYNPIIGRFLTMDSYVGNTVEPWPWHLYSYCDGDPVNSNDPTGHARVRVGKSRRRSGNVTIVQADYKTNKFLSNQMVTLRQTATFQIFQENGSWKVQIIEKKGYFSFHKSNGIFGFGWAVKDNGWDNSVATLITIPDRRYECIEVQSTLRCRWTVPVGIFSVPIANRVFSIIVRCDNHGFTSQWHKDT
jgi:RHS repeat-associated protein